MGTLNKPLALGLFSGGLDSILACRVIAAQGIQVVALKFVTPFFDHDLLHQQEAYQQAMQRRYGLAVEVIDISAGYVRLLDQPVHGFGKHFNPCIDCKIMMLSKARELMPAYGASFLFTGEVLGQRPMSQRRDTLRVIERDSGCEGLLLRPLSAKLMPPTPAEREGLVDRNRLYDFSGRGRKPQKQLAAHLGITDYPAPAGGCMLTDPNLASRIRHFYQGLFGFGEQRAVADIRLLTLGRQFKLDGDIWCILGRDERENIRLESLRGSDDWLVSMTSRPGPLALVRYGCLTVGNSRQEAEVIRLVAGLVVRYGKKVSGAAQAAEVRIDTGDGVQEQGIFTPLTEEQFASWLRI